MDNARRMTHDDGRPSIAIGHPSDSGDLNSKNRHVHNIDHNKFSVFVITHNNFAKLSNQTVAFGLTTSGNR